MRKMTWIIIFGIIITMQFGLVNCVIAGQEWNEARGKAFNCSIAGVWEFMDGSLATVVPLDPTGKRYSVIHDAPKPPRANFILGLTQGFLEKIGPNLYEGTAYRYGVYENPISGQNEIKVLIIIRSQTKFIDCDTRVVTSAYQVYSADGTPLPGSCVQATGETYRIESTPPCGGGLLPFPE